LSEELDRIRQTLRQVRALANQAIRTGTPVNAYRLEAALDGDTVTGPETDDSMVSLEQVWDEGHEEGVLSTVTGREQRAENPYKGR
jgi:hypothetical protein